MEYKGYLIRPNKTYPTLYDIQVQGRGGKVPDLFKSLFTSYGEASEAIDRYLNRKK